MQRSHRPPPLLSQARRFTHNSLNRDTKEITMPKTILVTGAGSGFGQGAAIGMAKNGHTVIATVQVSPQVMPLREKAKQLGLANFRVERLDLTDPYDIAQAQSWDFDVLWNNAGQGEAGPVWEIPVDLVRRNYEINVFLPLVLTQGVVRKWVANKKKGKVVFTSSMGGLFTPANWGIYVSTKHALEAIAEAMQQELAPYGIKVQTINPGAYYTGYNETMADNPFRWLDDSKHFTKRADLRKGFDDFFATPEGRMDPKEMIDRMIDVVPADNGLFRNVVPKAIEDMLKKHQVAAWSNAI
jgi:NAD(P)-dependent dehydrogenase (short-subunit alcohol dehydrogenase family)